eukprot:gnl/TRDRNA2_/TRDRNA2_140334_c0_seq5.p2 gnl/TRDRNA2_/TRDRNA2_140334_c0~~gnl/TRDRNA2_/TRDRNA2_140334_c0_seq5.p2  ORF type:complete len:107 (-),score=13.76 gnl/TRDRNA2_/TRDRNA2_140334_c0_seq5:263-583(-)
MPDVSLTLAHPSLPPVPPLQLSAGRRLAADAEGASRRLAGSGSDWRPGAGWPGRRAVVPDEADPEATEGGGPQAVRTAVMGPEDILSGTERGYGGVCDGVLPLGLT